MNNIYLIICLILFVASCLFSSVAQSKFKAIQSKEKEINEKFKAATDMLNKSQDQVKEATLKAQKANLESAEAEKKAYEANKRYEEANSFILRNVKKQAEIDSQLKSAKEELDFNLKEIDKIQKQIRENQENFEKTSAAAADNYFKVLEQSYISEEQKYKDKIDKINADIDQYKKELGQIRDNRAAALEALRKEKQIKEDKAKYSLSPSYDDLNDIVELEHLRKKFKKPRVISMLIWQTYFSPLAKKRFVEILGTKTICGIYKITNQETNECYIGQSVDVYKRWCDHVKCGIGIDTPIGNKLYQAMGEYGIPAFTFELLQECAREELDKQEKYFISLYESDSYGYNSTAGNGK